MGNGTVHPAGHNAARRTGPGCGLGYRAGLPTALRPVWGFVAIPETDLSPRERAFAGAVLVFMLAYLLVAWLMDDGDDDD